MIISRCCAMHYKDPWMLIWDGEKKRHKLILWLDIHGMMRSIAGDI